MTPGQAAADAFDEYLNGVSVERLDKDRPAVTAEAWDAAAAAAVHTVLPSADPNVTYAPVTPLEQMKRPERLEHAATKLLERSLSSDATLSEAASALTAASGAFDDAERLRSTAARGYS